MDLFSPPHLVPQCYPLWVTWTTGEECKTQLIIAWQRSIAGNLHPILDSGACLNNLYPDGTPYSYFVGSAADPNPVSLENLKASFREMTKDMVQG